MRPRCWESYTAGHPTDCTACQADRAWVRARDERDHAAVQAAIERILAERKLNRGVLVDCADPEKRTRTGERHRDGWGIIWMVSAGRAMTRFWSGPTADRAAWKPEGW